jgi:hypothetical protein
MTRPPQAFHTGLNRPREIDHDSNLCATYRQEESRLRDEHGDLEIRRVLRAASARNKSRRLVSPEGIDHGKAAEGRSRVAEALRASQFETNLENW